MDKIFHLLKILSIYELLYTAAKPISNVFKKIIKKYSPNAIVNYIAIIETDKCLSYIAIDTQDITQVEDLNKLILVEKIPINFKGEISSANLVVLLNWDQLSKIDIKLLVDYIYNLVDKLIKTTINNSSVDLNEKPLVDYFNNRQNAVLPSVYDTIYILLKMHMTLSLVYNIRTDINLNTAKKVVLENKFKIKVLYSEKVMKILTDDAFANTLIYNPLLIITDFI